MRTVTLENATIDALAARADAVAALPQVFRNFASAVKAAGGCNCKGVRKDVSHLYARAKATVLNLDEAGLATLKALLGADAVVVYLAGPGQPIRHQI